MDLSEINEQIRELQEELGSILQATQDADEHVFLSGIYESLPDLFLARSELEDGGDSRAQAREYLVRAVSACTAGATMAPADHDQKGNFWPEQPNCQPRHSKPLARREISPRRSVLAIRLWNISIPDRRNTPAFLPTKPITTPCALRERKAQTWPISTRPSPKQSWPEECSLKLVLAPCSLSSTMTCPPCILTASSRRVSQATWSKRKSCPEKSWKIAAQRANPVLRFGS